MPGMVTENPNRLGKWHKMAADGDQLPPAKFRDLFLLVLFNSEREIRLRLSLVVNFSSSVNSVA